MSASENDGPTAFAMAFATGIICIATGYFLGQGSSIGLFGSSGSGSSRGKKGGSRSKSSKAPKSSWPNSYDVTVHPDSSDEELMAKLKGGAGTAHRNQAEDEEEDGNNSSPSDDDEEDEDEDDDPSAELQSFPAHAHEEHKLVLVVRTDLGMKRGKMCAQSGHATLACYTYLQKHAPASSRLLERWMGGNGGQAKVALQCAGEEELLTLQAQALSLGLCARVVRDAGRTQIQAGSATVLGVGPGPKSVVDAVTGGLKLL